MNRTLEVADLKRTTRILDVLARYGIQAEQKGRQYMAKCPFHDDSTPSLSVDPIKNVWHCFGCGVGGSVLDFVMKKDGLNVRDAFSFLFYMQPTHRQLFALFLSFICSHTFMNYIELLY